MTDMSSWIMWSLVKLLTLVALAFGLHSDPLSEVVESCFAANQKFSRREGKYIDRRMHPAEEPDINGKLFSELQMNVYARERRQRPFECISNRTHGLSNWDLEINPTYQAKVLECEKKQQKPNCNSNKYRTIDGTCNNIMHPKWGSLYSCLQRLIPQNYVGVSGFRQSVCGGPLPEPRTLSRRVHLDKIVPSADVAHMGILFGQFLAHDLEDTANTFVGVKPIDCCSQPPGEKQHPQCAPIIIKKDDPFYSMFNVSCFDFVRAAICDTCDIGKRNQINIVTSYLDLSVVYGTTNRMAKKLRSKTEKGKLDHQNHNGEELLPPDPLLDASGGCGLEQVTCFLAGDRRVNVQSVLMTLHTIFVREHNRIVDELSKLRLDWDDEILYQEARKINIAQMQVITYKEFLPLIIGPELMTQHRLWLDYESVYDVTIDATVPAEFNGAAFRLHTGLSGIVTNNVCPSADINLRNLMQNAEPLYAGNMSCLMRGACQYPAQTFDRHVAEDMQNFVYKTPKKNRGFDIKSLNIQRGRDIGLPPYIEIVKYLTGGKTDIQTFEDLSCCMDQSNIDILKQNYCEVQDIDPWVGMNNEKVREGMYVGPTAGQIIAEHFRNLKYGDRFFFQHEDNFNYFQILALKQASFARMMCDNTKIQSIQESAFRSESFWNPIKDCEAIPKVNLWFWSWS